MALVGVFYPYNRGALFTALLLIKHKLLARKRAQTTRFKSTVEIIVVELETRADLASFLCGGSTGIFVYSYCLYYYYTRSGMSGFMQTSFFFGYVACVCYGFFLMLGTVGFRASLLFVRHIYRSIKRE
ncbi:hypothetical protein RND71_002432 [Anisodus tanguticus]|uniref:Transmembrane 9 superfamily member n=1 Tax=Anisodus tanguticus TaxID=243964 RepID=A0AAE1T327_9SOLA|nr:hypothetical protein RND71_002432 [Anisodus tanguticus]